MLYRLVLVAVCTLLYVDNSVCVTVKASVGDILGYVEHLNISEVPTTVTRFLGIPFAETTAGANRFRKPVKKAAFAQPFDAAQDGPRCFQGNHGSEDCLHLNVYAPSSAILQSALLPVMIWIHGGAYVKGSAHNYHPEVLCTHGNVIVVTINYRLGEFGFLSTGNSESPGNYGLWDQHLAIQWVNTNIRSFGGDPNEVTIFGESAGGASCMLQALYPGNTGLFKRVIAESGTALNGWSFTKYHSGGKLLKANNCNDVDCLRSKSATELQIEVGHNHLHGFVPTIDNDFLHESPKDILEKNHPISSQARTIFSSLDVMTGVNSMEGALTIGSTWKSLLHISNIENFAVSSYQFDHVVIPKVIRTTFGNSLPSSTFHHLTSSISSMYLNTAERSDPLIIRDKVLKMTSDLSFFLPAIRTVKDHSRLTTNRSTYLYEFSQQPTHRHSNTPSWVHGPTHADEIQYVFGRPLVNPGYSTAEQDLSSTMMTMWTNFAKSGDPNTPTDVTKFTNSTWPIYDMTSQQYLDIAGNMSRSSVRDHFVGDVETFWLQSVPQIIQQGGTDPLVG